MILTSPPIKVILPFTIGVYSLATHQYMLDPLLALAGLSEYTFLSFHRGKDRYVKKLFNKRALMLIVEILFIDAALCALFIFVPGRHL